MLSSQIAPALESVALHKVKMSNLRAKLLEEEAKHLKVVNDKLEESNTDLEKANTKLNDFVAIVAHDLRNPIGAIHSYSVLLKKSLDSKKIDLGEKNHRIIIRITDLCDLSIGLIRNILELGALGSGKLVLHKNKFLISEILDEAYENVLFFAEKKSVGLLKNGQSDKFVHVDKDRIIQVMTNLLTNAIKFTPSQGQVELNFFENEKEKSVTIEVKDNGIGIPDEILGKLFDKEAVTSTSGTDGEKGTGFGLPLCQDLAKEHGSIIKVESKIDEGSRFYFNINY
jgi:signal transduction histidine kinase